jgi:polyhydroxyalkanoate synthesis regulator phasin
MQDFIKRAFLMSAGLAVMTADKMKELMDELVKKGELSEKEARETLEELKEKSKQTKKEWEERIEDTIHVVMKRMNIPSCKELDELKDRLAKLEQLKKAKE